MEQKNNTGDQILETNEAWWDRLLRFILGGGLVALTAFHITGYWGYLGLIVLWTAFLGYCPLYHYLGKSTCPLKTTTNEKV